MNTSDTAVRGGEMPVQILVPDLAALFPRPIAAGDRDRYAWELPVCDLLATLARAGFAPVAVDNGDGKIETLTLLAAVGEICAVDDARVYVQHEGEKPFWLFIVLGNSCYDLVSDYSARDSAGGRALDVLLSAWSDKWEGVPTPTLGLVECAKAGGFAALAAPVAPRVAFPGGPPLAPVTLHPAGDRILAFICEELLEGDRLPHQDWEMPDGNGTLGDALRAYNAAAQAAEGAQVSALSAEPVALNVLSGFGAWVLDLLQESEDWGADTLNEIAHRAQMLGLARGTASGDFERVRDGLALAAEPARSEVVAFPALLIYHCRGAVHSFDMVHGSGELARMQAIRAAEHGGDVVAVVVSMSDALNAGSYVAAIRRLLACPDLNLESLERETLAAIDQAEDALAVPSHRRHHVNA